MTNQQDIIQITTNDGSPDRCRHVLYTRSGGAIVTKHTNVVLGFVTQAEPLRTRVSRAAAVNGQGRVC
jgi:hypothetical protein